LAGAFGGSLVVVLHLFNVRLSLDAQTPLQVLLVAIVGIMLFQ